ncbi:MAG: 50S ribosomal protein L18 [Candidatus Bathyarchaeia archaeon]
MAKGPTYNLPMRRRRENRTDYQARRRLLASGKPRLVIRMTGSHAITQLVKAEPSGDRVLASANSAELRGFGWKAGLKDLPAAYLTGLLAGMRAAARKVEEAILDIGTRRVTRGSRIFSALKGAVDSGLKIPHSEDILPDPARVRGEHIAEYAKKLSADPELYKRRFSRYLAAGLKPEDLPEHFEQVKKGLLQAIREA